MNVYLWCLVEIVVVGSIHYCFVVNSLAIDTVNLVEEKSVVFVLRNQLIDDLLVNQIVLTTPADIGCTKQTVNSYTDPCVSDGSVISLDANCLAWKPKDQAAVG